jgi:hypothetical protein
MKEDPAMKPVQNAKHESKTLGSLSALIAAIRALPFAVGSPQIFHGIKTPDSTISVFSKIFNGKPAHLSLEPGCYPQCRSSRC